jgi:hypothetical protein
LAVQFRYRAAAAAATPARGTAAEYTIGDDAGIEEGTGIAVVFASASDWIRHSPCEPGFEGLSWQWPVGAQQVFAAMVFAANDGNMKYCAQERHPPHSNVAASTAAIQKLAIFLNRTNLSVRFHCTSGAPKRFPAFSAACRV